jgi:hypothetical protein
MCYEQRSSPIPEIKRNIFTNIFLVLTKNTFRDYEMNI